MIRAAMITGVYVETRILKPRPSRTICKIKDNTIADGYARYEVSFFNLSIF